MCASAKRPHRGAPLQLRHPNILQFKDTAEVEERGETVILVVTEPVMPLAEHLASLQIQGPQRAQYVAMGQMTDAQWLWRAETSVRRLPDGRWTLHYDPRITAELVNRPPDFNLWTEYEGVTCPVLVLRGANSKVLTEETALQMTQRGPKAKVEILADCGHPPALNTPERVTLIHDFISG